MQEVFTWLLALCKAGRSWEAGWTGMSWIAFLDCIWTSQWVMISFRIRIRIRIRVRSHTCTAILNCFQPDAHTAGKGGHAAPEMQS